MISISACTSVEPEEARLEVAWELGEVFASPESAIYDPGREVIYVSSVNGYAKNGEGYLSRIGVDGETLDRRWVEGLDAPTGMALAEDRLYVVDLDAVVVISTLDAEILRRIPAPEVGLGLNDIVWAKQRGFVVSASAASALYRLEEDRWVRWVRDPRLRDANGLLVVGDALLVAGWDLHRVSLVDASITPVDLGGLEDLETLAPLGDGSYVISTIGERPLYRWHVDRPPTELLRRDAYSADLHFAAELGLLLVPSGGDRLVSYRVR